MWVLILKQNVNDMRILLLFSILCSFPVGKHIVHLGAQTTDKDIAAHCKGVIEKWRDASKGPNLVHQWWPAGPPPPMTPPRPGPSMTPPRPHSPMTPPGTPPSSVTLDGNGNLATDIKRLVEMLIEDRNQMAKERNQMTEERNQMAEERDQMAQERGQMTKERDEMAKQKEKVNKRYHKKKQKIRILSEQVSLYKRALDTIAMTATATTRM